MRTPPEGRRAHPRAGRNFEEDLNLRYLAPGAFTILPPEHNVPPQPPSAPEPYRLTPSTRRHKNSSFAIIGEPTSSNPGSRSSSPSGRVSPFKGRGFNPAGSRFASPNPSPPPPEDARLTPTKVSPRHTSRIPKYSRRGSAAAFGEKVSHYEPSFGKNSQHQQPSNRGNLNSNQLSQSLSSLESKQVVSKKRPPISPRKNAHSKNPAFQRLSPIVGSSPEPSQSQSSPSRIPTKSRSTPPSRFTSPTRPTNDKPPSRAPSRSVSRSQIRSSRDASPSDNSSPSPRKNPAAKSNYKHVQPKVNSFNKPKPKVPPKPQFLSEQSEESDVPLAVNSNKKPTLSRNNSVTKRTNSKSNILPKTSNNHVNNNNQSDSSSTEVSSSKNSSNINKAGNASNITKTGTGNVENNNSINNKNVVNNSNNSKQNKPNTEKSKTETPRKDNNSVNSKTNSTKNSKEDLSSSKFQLDKIKPDKMNLNSNSEDTDSHADPLPSAVVSSTTSTVTKPLHIEAKLAQTTYDRPKPVSPMVDGRILSATSVSHALNKMNDTVMNTQTVIKDHGPSKLSPAASAVIAVANEQKNKGSTVATKPGSDTSINESKASSVVLDTSSGTVEKQATGVGGNKVELPAAPAIDNTTKTASGTHNRDQNNRTNHTNNSLSSNSIGSNNHNISNNHVSHIGIGTSKAIELEVQRNMDKLISADGKITDNSLNSVKMSANDRIKEARTMIAADVQPIKITVREKPLDVEVQSGNVGLPVSIANGISEIRPGPDEATNKVAKA